MAVLVGVVGNQLQNQGFFVVSERCEDDTRRFHFADVGTKGRNEQRFGFLIADKFVAGGHDNFFKSENACGFVCKFAVCRQISERKFLISARFEAVESRGVKLVVNNLFCCYEVALLKLGLQASDEPEIYDKLRAVNVDCVLGSRRGSDFADAAI